MGGGGGARVAGAGAGSPPRASRFLPPFYAARRLTAAIVLRCPHREGRHRDGRLRADAGRDSGRRLVGLATAGKAMAADPRGQVDPRAQPQRSGRSPMLAASARRAVLLAARYRRLIHRAGVIPRTIRPAPVRLRSAFPPRLGPLPFGVAGLFCWVTIGRQEPALSQTGVPNGRRRPRRIAVVEWPKTPAGQASRLVGARGFEPPAPSSRS